MDDLCAWTTRKLSMNKRNNNGRRSSTTTLKAATSLHCKMQRSKFHHIHIYMAGGRIYIIKWNADAWLSGQK